MGFFSIMKVVLFLILCLSRSFLFAQVSFDSESVISERELQFTIIEGSQLIIQGETNVNSFDCAFTDKNLLSAVSFRGKVFDRRISFLDAFLHLPVKELDCGSALMNDDLIKLLEADEFPEITVKFEEAFWYVETLWEEKEIEKNPIGYFTVKLSIAGVERFEEVNIYTTTLDRGKRVLSTTGVIVMDMREFGLEPPTKFLGMVKVKETLSILIDLNFSWKENN